MKNGSKVRNLLLLNLLLATIGCGGGGGDDTVARIAPVTIDTAPQPNPPATGEGVPKTFNFPTFRSGSKLTVVANFQTAGETPNVTETAAASVSSLNDGLAGRIAARYAGAAGEQIFNPCGYPDVSAMSHLTRDFDAPSSTLARDVQPRYAELAEGARREFFLAPAFRSVTAEKILDPEETTHCTIFAEVVDGQPAITRSKALAVARAFDSNNPQRPGSGIYDQVREVFGSEWNQNPPGGNDGDEKVVILFFSSQTLSSNLFGFVSPADADPNGGDNSNRAEIIYINADKSIYQTLASICHEFQHVVNLNQKINRQGLNPAGAEAENVSLNEGLSGLAEEVCGYTFESGNELLVDVTNAYLKRPHEHEFFDFFQAGLGYGQTYLFFKYVREHFDDRTIRAIATDSRVGLDNLNANLPIGFPEAFRRWSIANYATNLSGPVPSIYRYPSGFRTDGEYEAGRLVGVTAQPMENNDTVKSPPLLPWSVAYFTLESLAAAGVSTTVTPAGDSPFGVVFEQSEGGFTSFHD